jgi:hypothetical protein
MGSKKVPSPSHAPGTRTTPFRRVRARASL